MRESLQRSEAMTAVVIGPLFLDVVFSALARVPEPGEELWSERCSFVAGGAANQARALHRIGFEARLCSYLGEDLPGRMVATLLNDDGLCTASLQPTAHQAVTAAISVGSDRAMISAGMNEAPLLSGAAPGLLMGDLRALERNRETVRQWRESGTFVVGDVGWDESGRWDPSDLASLDLVDVFVPNEDEACHYMRADSAQEAAAQLTRLVPTVVVTRGAEGVVAAVAQSEETGAGTKVAAGTTASIATNVAVRDSNTASERECTPSDILSLPAFPARSVDPTGAGDVFSAVLAWGLLRGGTLRQAASAAALAGALSTERLGGAGAPTLSELRERALASVSEGAPSHYDLSLLTAS
ncbi:MAG: carbohydrate kinase family protein [Ancrocorticia sp.]